MTTDLLKMLHWGKTLVPIGMPELWNLPLWVKPLIAFWLLGNTQSPPPGGPTPVHSSLLFTSVYCSKATSVPLRRKLWAPILEGSPLPPIGSFQASVALTYHEDGPRYPQRLPVPISCTLQEAGAQARSRSGSKPTLSPSSLPSSAGSLLPVCASQKFTGNVGMKKSPGHVTLALLNPFKFPKDSSSHLHSLERSMGPRLIVVLQARKAGSKDLPTLR